MCVGQYSYLRVVVCCGDYILHLGRNIVYTFFGCCTWYYNMPTALAVDEVSFRNFSGGRRGQTAFGSGGWGVCINKKNLPTTGLQDSKWRFAKQINLLPKKFHPKGIRNVFTHRKQQKHPHERDHWDLWCGHGDSFCRNEKIHILGEQNGSGIICVRGASQVLRIIQGQNEQVSDLLFAAFHVGARRSRGTAWKQRF